MILEPGQFGIVAIHNTNTSVVREMIMVYKGMNLNGMPSMISLVKSRNAVYEHIPAYRDGKITRDAGYIVELGYNENIFVKDRASAIMLLNIINAVLVEGASAEKAIDNMLDAVQNVFFQEAK